MVGILMIEFIPDMLRISLSFALGITAFLLYSRKRKTCLAIFGVAFFLFAVPSIVEMVLGGPYMPLRLMDRGYSIVEIGIIQFYLFLLSTAFEVASAILILVGLIKTAGSK